MKAKDGFILKEVGTDWVLVPVGQRVVQFNKMMVLTHTGALIYKMIQNGKTIDQIVQNLVNEYKIDIEIAIKDVDIFIQELLEYNLIEE
jgi:hypothetical protein